jgi:hypothetical protein
LNQLGIVSCSKNLDWDSFAIEIDRVLSSKDSIAGEVVRVTRPMK